MQLTQPALIDWHAKGRFITLEDHSIFMIDEGKKDLPVIILIHGFPTSSWDWHAVWPLLGERFRLITIDMLGFGFSAKPIKHQYSIHEQADLFEGLIKDLALDQFHLLVHDYGVSVAQELLARQMEQPRKNNCLSCCFLNGGLFPETHQALFVQKLLLSPLGALINSLSGYTLFAKSFSRVFGIHTKPSAQALKEFWQLINVNQGKHVFHTLISYMNDRKAYRQRWVNALQQSEIPLGLINGSDDPVSGKHLIVRYKALICRLDYLSELPEIGHYPQVEAPISVAESFFNFLLSHPRK